MENPELRLSAYDYELPPELIAQTPAEPRDSARLLVLDRSKPDLEHRHVSDLPEFLRPGDLLVANRTRVLPSRLHGRKQDSGGNVELLLLRPTRDGAWEALVKAHRLREGQQVVLPGGAIAEIGPLVGGTRQVRFHGTDDVPALLHAHGEIPLPPYIHGYQGDPERYQTTYAEVEGSAAAPTAGLHLTTELLIRLQAQGVGWATVLLHVGLDTFRPITEEDVRAHHIHTEWIEVDKETVEAVRATRARGGRVVAVGTTTVRALEHAAADGELRPYRGNADLFITPGYRYRSVDALMTNFHLPKSSLLLLVSALAGRERILRAYAEAVRLRYRFFSFGDAMLIL
jgi:S-adenosylmethionine:tRNA ribosyltransferase-isomerase